MPREPKVRVKLAAKCLVNGVKREAGEIVEIEESIAEFFGTPPTAKDVKESVPAAEPVPAKA